MASMMACTSATAVMAGPVATVAKVQDVNASRSLAMAPLGVSAMRGQKLQVASSRSRVMMTAAKPGPEIAVGVPEPESKGEKELPSVDKAPEGFTPPQLNPDTPSPIFGGSTGGLLRKAQVEEFYVITWEAPKEQIFELPTGGAAIMRSGPNLLKLSRKEQCLALGSALRSKFKIVYQFYRVFPNGEVQYLHPKDGVYPEKVNAGRSGVGINARSIGKNANPVTVKFSGKSVVDL